MTERCLWCQGDPLYEHYHDTEWGVPCYDDHKLFESILLEGAQAGLSWITVLRKREGAQAGLSWITVLRKREGYRLAFDGFDPHQIARYDERRIEKLRLNPNIIRNRLKIKSTVTNAQAFLNLVERQSSFSEFVWQFVDGSPRDNQFLTADQVPASTPASDAMSKALKKAGFSFVGSTICYAFMQATGMVNDHLLSCHRHHQVKLMKNQ
ncbi:MAG: DNA-3-methyladenine glycosylase I [Cellvibrionaceae bacterium]